MNLRFNVKIMPFPCFHVTFNEIHSILYVLHGFHASRHPELMCFNNLMFNFQTRTLIKFEMNGSRNCDEITRRKNGANGLLMNSQNSDELAILQMVRSNLMRSFSLSVSPDTTPLSLTHRKSRIEATLAKSKREEGS